MVFLEKATERAASDTDFQAQGSGAWHDFRAKHIGASEVSAVLEESDFMTPYELWLIKTGQRDGFQGNWATERGKNAEQRIRELYEEKYAVKLTAPVLEYPAWPTLSASLDGYLERAKLVVEFKYPSKEKHALAVNGIVPKTYRAQIQAQMLVAGAESAHYVSFDGSGIAVVEVAADYAEQMRIVAACMSFWELVMTKVPPAGAPVFLESDTLETLAEQYTKLNRILFHTESEMLLIRQKLDEIVEEDKAKFYGLTLTRTERIGAVDYNKVPELRGVDLDAYRKSPIKVLTIKVDK